MLYLADSVRIKLYPQSDIFHCTEGKKIKCEAQGMRDFVMYNSIVPSPFIVCEYIIVGTQPGLLQPVMKPLNNCSR